MVLINTNIHSKTINEDIDNTFIANKHLLIPLFYTVKKYNHKKQTLLKIYGGARGVMVIVVGIGHGDTSSNPGRD